jgi:predicted kinase
VNLYLLCGLAFSGKSTLAAVLARRCGAEVVSLDEINAGRGLDGGAGIPEEEWVRTHQEALRRVDQGLAAGRPVVMDDTNCFRFLRDSYRAVAERHGARVRVLYLDRPLALLAERRRENERTGIRAPIAEPVLLDLVRKFEPPGADEDVLLVPPDSSLEEWVAEQIPAR